MPKRAQTWLETLITAVIKASGYSAILFVAVIFIFLMKEIGRAHV